MFSFIDRDTLGWTRGSLQSYQSQGTPRPQSSCLGPAPAAKACPAPPQVPGEPRMETAGSKTPGKPPWPTRDLPVGSPAVVTQQTRLLRSSLFPTRRTCICWVSGRHLLFPFPFFKWKPLLLFCPSPELIYRVCCGRHTDLLARSCGANPAPTGRGTQQTSGFFPQREGGMSNGVLS